MSKLAAFGVVAVSLSIACGSVSVTPSGPDAAIPQDAALPPPDKLDLVFAIDNSRSMADKQALLAETIPDLVSRLLTPRCLVTASPDQVQPRLADGSCPSGTTSEIIPVTNLHVGIVTSSLGGGGAEQAGGSPICAPSSLDPIFNKYNSHNDDKGHLINRKRPTTANASGVEDSVADANAIDGSGGNFLAWLPNITSNKNAPKPNVTALTDAPTVTADFQALVTGAGEYGCGLEAQLESWYRFLVQPDPYDAITMTPDAPPKATLTGTDATLLKQRHDFLRPDSVVVIVQLTDEEDSWSDPLAVGGRGWVTRSTTFPNSPTNLMPLGTSACNAPIDPNNPTTTGPNDPNCVSCGFAGNMPNGKPISGDPNCMIACGANCTGYYTASQDSLNVRYTNDAKRRYGIDFQFPVQRYVDGLTSNKVPDRNGEHPNGAGSYKGTKNCTNPLFAASLPTDGGGDLCNLPLGPRTKDMIFYVHVGGVPWQLLTDAQGNTKSTLTDQDWQTMLGRNPDNYDITGIDPHMIETTLPRTSANASQIPYLAGSLSPVASPDNADPMNGREWNTAKSPLGLDLQYACIFDLPTPKECTDPVNAPSCDCVASATDADGPPLCADGAKTRSKQVRGKAYPTIRELRVAKALGNQGIVGSICARSTDKNSPYYGYRSTVDQLLHRLRGVIAQ
jgi:hypothetical protein